MKIEWREPKKRSKRKKAQNILYPADTEMINPAIMDLLNGDMNPFNDLWELDLNFRITHSLQDKIEKVDGVEIILIGTPYRMKLGIGRLFDQDEVRSKIQEVLKEHYKCSKK